MSVKKRRTRTDLHRPKRPQPTKAPLKATIPRGKQVDPPKGSIPPIKESPSPPPPQDQLTFGKAKIKTPTLGPFARPQDLKKTPVKAAPSFSRPARLLTWVMMGLIIGSFTSIYWLTPRSSSDEIEANEDSLPWEQMEAMDMTKPLDPASLAHLKSLPIIDDPPSLELSKETPIPAAKEQIAATKKDRARAQDVAQPLLETKDSQAKDSEAKKETPPSSPAPILGSKPVKHSSIEGITFYDQKETLKIRFLLRNLINQKNDGFVYGVAKIKTPSGEIIYQTAPAAVQTSSDGKPQHPHKGISYEIRSMVHKKLEFKKSDGEILGVKLFAHALDGSVTSLLMAPGD